LKSEINKANVEQAGNIPTLADLALKYGTISREQHTRLLTHLTGGGDTVDIGMLLLDKGMATSYQLELLKLIQEYHIVRKTGEEFGKIAVEKGFAAVADIRQALKRQKREFKKFRHKKLIGDILVETRIITLKQKESVLKAQALFNKQAHDLFAKEARVSKNVEKNTDREGEQQKEIRIFTSADHMTAWVEIGSHAEMAVTLDQVKDAALSDGIVNGVYPDPFIQCCLDVGVKKFPVARVDCSGLLRQQSHLAFHIKDDNGNTVARKKGDLLMDRTDAGLELHVENLYGETGRAAAENDFAVRCGVNARWSKDRLKILAVKSGNPSLSAGRRVFIHPVVHILEDADLRYGPVEPYADLTVSGTITGAYPVTAGKVSADEIRGANINAIGDVHARVGITDTVVRAQGDVHARYVHNSRIEAFGNVYVQNEIIDAQIRSSAKFKGPECRVISSRIYAKGGVLLLGVGSERSAPSTIVAGSEHHVVGLVQRILDVMNSIFGRLEELKGEKRFQQSQAEKIFKKMIELKTFHDKAKKKKDALFARLNEKKADLNKKTLANIQRLISTYEKRMNHSLATLKTMNVSKKEHDASIGELEKKISIFAAQAEKDILSHEKTLFAYLEKSKETAGIPVVEIKGNAYSGTNIGGIYQVFPLADEKKGFKVEELRRRGRAPELRFIDLNQ